MSHNCLLIIRMNGLEESHTLTLKVFFFFFFFILSYQCHIQLQSCLFLSKYHIGIRKSHTSRTRYGYIFLALLHFHFLWFAGSISFAFSPCTREISLLQSQSEEDFLDVVIIFPCIIRCYSCWLVHALFCYFYFARLLFHFIFLLFCVEISVFVR